MVDQSKIDELVIATVNKHLNMFQEEEKPQDEREYERIHSNICCVCFDKLKELLKRVCMNNSTTFMNKFHLFMAKVILLCN